MSSTDKESKKLLEESRAIMYDLEHAGCSFVYRIKMQEMFKKMHKQLVEQEKEVEDLVSKNWLLARSSSELRDQISELNAPKENEKEKELVELLNECKKFLVKTTTYSAITQGQDLNQWVRKVVSVTSQYNDRITSGEKFYRAA